MADKKQRFSRYEKIIENIISVEIELCKTLSTST